MTILKLLLDLTHNYNTYLKLYCSQQVSIDSWPSNVEKIILRFPYSECSYVFSNVGVMFSQDGFLSFCFRGVKFWWDHQNYNMRLNKKSRYLRTCWKNVEVFVQQNTYVGLLVISISCCKLV